MYRCLCFALATAMLVNCTSIRHDPDARQPANVDAGRSAVQPLASGLTLDRSTVDAMVKAGVVNDRKVIFIGDQAIEKLTRTYKKERIRTADLGATVIIGCGLLLCAVIGGGIFKNKSERELLLLQYDEKYLDKYLEERTRGMEHLN